MLAKNITFGIGNLNYLEVLILSNNKILNVPPQTIENLTRLKIIFIIY